MATDLTLPGIPPQPGAPSPPRGPIGSVIAACLFVGAAAALVLSLVVVAGEREHVITGTALLGLSLGWGLLALLSGWRTDQPQRWALVPAAFLAVSGVALLVLAPGDRAMAALGWVWAPALLGPAAGVLLQARRRPFRAGPAWPV